MNNKKSEREIEMEIIKRFFVIIQNKRCCHVTFNGNKTKSKKQFCEKNKIPNENI